MEPSIFGSLLSWREQIKNMNTKKPRLFTLWLCRGFFFVCVGAFSRKRAVKEKKSTPAIRATVRTFSGNGDPLNVSP